LHHAAILTLFSFTGIENFIVAKTGVGAPNKKYWDYSPANRKIIGNAIRELVPQNPDILIIAFAFF
jgi:hypothetical protein